MSFVFSFLYRVSYSTVLCIGLPCFYRTNIRVQRQIAPHALPRRIGTFVAPDKRANKTINRRIFHVLGSSRRRQWIRTHGYALWSDECRLIMPFCNKTDTSATVKCGREHAVRDNCTRQNIRKPAAVRPTDGCRDRLVNSVLRPRTD